MRILFHAPGLAAFRPEMPMPHLLGVQATATDTLGGLRSTHQLTGNRGNIIHAEAPVKIFKKDPKRSAYGNIAMLQKALGPRYKERVAANFDLIIISMANFIRPDHDGATLFNALKALDGAVRFIVLGAGLQGSSTLADMMPGNRNLLDIMNERAALFGVRGEKTAAWLSDAGFHNTHVLGCPSLYAYPQSILSIDGRAARAKGAAADVMTAGHLSLHRGKIVPRGLELARAFRGIDASYVFQDEFFAYGDLPEKAFLYNEGSNECAAGPLNGWLSRQSGVPVDFRRYYYFTEAGSWRQAALRHDVFIGDRFHGGVAVLQAGRPAIFLKHDNRVSELTSHFNLPSLPTEEFAAKGLVATMEEYLSDEALARMRKLYRQRHAEFSKAVAAHGVVVETRLPTEDPHPIPAPPIQIGGAKARPQKLEVALPRKDATPTLTLMEHYLLRTTIPVEAREVVVSFEAVDPTINRNNPLRLGFGEKFLLDSGYAVVSVLTNTANWYRQPGLLEHLTSGAFQTLLGGFDRVHSYGSSMGGYGACTFAKVLGCQNVVALQPISTLAANLVPWETRFQHGRNLNWTGAHLDAAEGIEDCASVYAFYDPNTHDARHADRLAATAKERLHRVGIPGAQHAVPRHLLSLGLLKEATLMALQRKPATDISAMIGKARR